MSRTTTTLLWLLLVFASGTTVGIVGHRYFTPQPAREQQRPSRDQIRQDYLSKLRERIGLNEDQIAKVVVVLDSARAESDSLRQEFDADMRSMQHRTRDQIRSLMTPEQVQKYDAWREERKREREKRDAERGMKEKAR